MRRAVILVVAAFATVSAATAKDYFAHWDVKGLLQPQVRFDPRQQPWFHFNRVRAYVSGPFTKELKGGLTVDRSTDRIKLLDLYLDYTPLDGPVKLSLRAGQFFPAFTKAGVALPTGVDYPMATEALKLQGRQAGVQATVTVDKQWQAAAGIFNGVGKFDDTNDRPLYFGAFTAIQPWFDARLWGMYGVDGTNLKPTTTNMWGAEFTNIRLGRFSGDAAVTVGRRYGKRTYGAYGELGYRFDRERFIYGQVDWAILDGATAGSGRQRYTLGLQQRVNKWILAKFDTQYLQGSNDVRGVGQLDVWF